LIDLHCHILPGIDDGPATMDGSLELARSLVMSGVTTVAATPHLRGDHPDVVPAELGDRCRELQEHMDAESLNLTVVPGGELDLTWGLDASEEELRQTSFAQRGTDLMVETPYGPLPSTFEDLLGHIAVRGKRILLAHPERNPSFQEDPARLEALVAGGVLVQVTASSLAGSPKRSRSAGLARDLVGRGLAHVIATDSHGPGAAGRTSLDAGRAAAWDILGGQADWMIWEAPWAVLNGSPLPPVPAAAEGPPRRGLLRRKRRRAP
jgi:protein-tyrosine phosphatase